MWMVCTLNIPWLLLVVPGPWHACLSVCLCPAACLSPCLRVCLPACPPVHLTTSPSVCVTAPRVNRPPVAVVSPANQTLYLPNSKALLEGSDSSDDLPSDQLHYSWEVVKAPLTWIRQDLPGSATLQLEGLTAGNYTIRYDRGTTLNGTTGGCTIRYSRGLVTTLYSASGSYTITTLRQGVTPYGWEMRTLASCTIQYAKQLAIYLHHLIARK